MMPNLPDLGRWLLWAGLGLAGLGLLFMLAGRLPWLGRLPGDIHIERDGASLYFPLATSLLLSLILTILLNVVIRLLK